MWIQIQSPGYNRILYVIDGLFIVGCSLHVGLSSSSIDFFNGGWHKSITWQIQFCSTVVKGRTIFMFSVGLGFGLMSGAFSLMNVLADSLGPGTLGTRGEPQV